MMKENSKSKKCLQLFTTFLKIGAVTFGGGYAMIPLITHEAAEKHNWITEGDMLNIVAIAESTPGPIAVNSATFVGSKVAGKCGAFCATAGVVLPSFCIILILSFFLDKFENLSAVRYAFDGIRAGVVALMVKAWFSMARQCPHNVFSYAVAALSFVAVGILKWNIPLVIVACGLSGLAFLWMTGRGGEK